LNEYLACLEKNLGAPRRGYLAPLLKCLGGDADRAFDIFGAGSRKTANKFPGVCGIAVLYIGAGPWGYPFSSDVIEIF
jgi:hypothetical protein